MSTARRFTTAALFSNYRIDSGYRFRVFFGVWTHSRNLKMKAKYILRMRVLCRYKIKGVCVVTQPSRHFETHREHNAYCDVNVLAKIAESYVRVVH